MGAQRTITLQPPLGGLNRQYGYESQPPFTSPDARNVRPQGTFEDRARVGSRPGIDKCGFAGLSTPLNMLASCEPFVGDGREWWEEDFGGTSLGGLWSAPSGWAAGHLIPIVKDGYAYSTTAAQWYTGVRAAMPTGFDQDTEYWVEMFVVPWKEGHESTYTLWGLMNDSSPAGTTDGVALQLTLSAGSTGTWDATLYHYINTTQTAYQIDGANLGYGQAGLLRMKIHRTSGTSATISGWWNNAAMTFTSGGGSSQAVTIDGDHGNRVGFSYRLDSAASKARVGHFRMQYKYTAASGIVPRRPVLLTSTNAKLYYETYKSLWTEVPQSAASVKSTLRSQGHIQAVQSNGVLYVADSSTQPDFSGTNATLLAAGGFILRDGSTFSGGSFLAAVPHGTLTGETTNNGRPRDHYVRLKSRAASQAGTPIDGDYRVVNRNGNDLWIYPTAQIASNLTDVEYEFWRGPKAFHLTRYNKVLPGTSTFELLGFRGGPDGPNFSNGNIPASCRLCAVFHDRLVLAGQPHAPHIWYMSYQGDFERWEIVDDDPRSAHFGTTQENSTGIPPQPITALVAHSDDYLIIGCERSLWVMRGDPSEGSLDNLSRDVGILGAKAWAITPEGWVIFLSHDGLYGLAPGGDQQPQPLSRDRLPRELMNLRLEQFEPMLEYDPTERGVHIFLVGKTYAAGATAPATNPRLHWWFDWDTRSFWPMTLSAATLPTSICVHDSNLDGRRAVLLGGRDGHVRQHIPEVKSDGGNDLQEYVLLGPFRLGGPEREGVIETIRTFMALDGGTIDYEIYVGETGEQAVRNAQDGVTNKWTGKVPAGRSYLDHPKARGAAAVIKIFGSGSDAHWAIESLELRLKQAGKMRAA